MFDDGRSNSCALADWWGSYPNDYIRPDDRDWDPVPDELEPFAPPRNFARWVNDRGPSRPGRDVNCADCARAVELCWRGTPQVSAARAPRHGGESRAQIEEWLGRKLEDHTFDSIGNGLESAGHGASAYIVVWWKEGGGHAFNAVNRDGEVYWIDAQPDRGIVELWPPHALRSSEGYDEGWVRKTVAALYNQDGSAL